MILKRRLTGENSTHFLTASAFMAYTSNALKIHFDQKKISLFTKGYFEKSFNHSGAGTISSRIDESYVKKLLGYFKRKGAR